MDAGHIFISYKSEQRHLALTVRDQLRDWGYEPWVDIDRLQPGTYWADAIDRALKSCRACLAVMTPQSIASRYVTNEWDMAIMKGKLFVPLMFERTEPHYKYIDIQYVDFTDTQKEPSFAQLRSLLDSQEPDFADARPQYPYHDYLQQLYDRINRYLSAKLITSLSDAEGRPEPIRLSTEVTKGAVDVLFDRRQEIDPLFAIGGIADEPARQFDDFAKAFDYYDSRVLLLGEPGSGKTITLLHHARDAVIKRQLDPSAPLPILGIIPTWNPDERPDIPDWLAASYGAPANVPELIRSGNALLLLDGLDELGDERPVDPDKPDGEMYDPRLRFVQKLPETGRILLTCRSKDYAEISTNVHLNGAITLKPLSTGQLSAYLVAQPELLALVTGDPHLQEWLDTPLLLSFFASAYEQMNAAEREAIAGFQSASELSAVIFSVYVRGNYDRIKAKPNVEVAFSLEDVYELMGWVSVRNIVSPLATDGRLGNHSFVARLDFAQILDFTELMVAMNVLVPTDDGGYQYVHMALRDHFASEHACGMITDANVENRLNAIYVFDTTRDSRAIPYLVERLDDDYARVRGAAAQLLGEIGDWTGTAGLIQLTRDGDKVIRKIALDAISKSSDARSIPLLVDALAHPSPAVQQAAANGLTNIGYPAGEELVRALRHESPGVRATAAQILAAIAFMPAVPSLKTLLSDETEVAFGMRVCDYVSEALADLES